MPRRLSAICRLSCLAGVLIGAIDHGARATEGGPGNLDPTFRAELGFDSPYGTISALAVQPDDMIVVAGFFPELLPSGAAVLLRLGPDGRRDPTFDHDPLFDGQVRPVDGLAVAQDGAIVVWLQVDRGHRLVRLDRQGRLDPSFDNGLEIAGWIRALALEPDGRLVLGGSFTNVGGMPAIGLARLEANGQPDPTFPASPVPVSREIAAIALLADGGMVLAGAWRQTVDDPSRNLVRLGADGAPDPGFRPSLPAGQTLYGLHALPLAGDRILVSLNQRADCENWRGNLLRLHGDGTLDTQFSAGQGANGQILSATITPDAKLLVRGDFTTFDGVPRRQIARLGPDGQLDTRFDPGVFLTDYNSRRHAAVQSDGSTLFSCAEARSGEFSTYGLARFRPGDQTPEPPAIVVQPASVSGIVDHAIVLEVSITSLGRPWFQWQRDGTPLEGATNQTFVLPRAKPEETGVYQALVGNEFGQTLSAPARVRVRPRFERPGALDLDYAPGWEDRQLRFVSAMVVAPDGRAVIGGAWAATQGNAAAVARLTPQGRPDPTFLPPLGIGDRGEVASLALQPDGRVLVGGHFTQTRGLGLSHLVRLEPDGSADPGFRPVLEPRASATNYALAVQSDGKIVIGGAFGSVNRIPRRALARLEPNGDLDLSFNPSAIRTNWHATIRGLWIQPDGRILAHGFFFAQTAVSSRSPTHLARFHPDGSLDPTFDAEASLGLGGNPTVFGLVGQSDGRLLVATSSGVRRLHADGRTDRSWRGTSLRAPSSTRSLALQPDGRILLGGPVSTACANRAAPGIVRARSTGDLDSPFDAGLGPQRPGGWTSVDAIAVQADGKILIGGQFDSVDLVPRRAIARLHGALPPARIEVALELEGAVRFSVRLDTVPGVLYALESTDSLAVPHWLPSPLPGVAGTGFVEQFCEATTESSQRYYRVRAE